MQKIRITVTRDRGTDIALWILVGLVAKHEGLPFMGILAFITAGCGAAIGIINAFKFRKRRNDA